MKTIRRYLVVLVILPLIVFLGSCSKTAENEHLPEYCQTYSGFMSTASKDLYDLIGDINRFNYLSVISEIELEFEVDDPNIEIDLNGIQCFQNLTSLTLIGQSFKDISPISALKNIQKIVLIDTSIVSIDSFKNLSKVNELTISNTKTLQSVDGVEEMTKLTRLDLSDNGIVNIEGLNNLVNLTELILSNNKITYFPSINQLELLETLDVSNNEIVQLGEDLSGLRNLKEFIARQNNICDLSTLDDLVSLEILDLSENDLGCGGLGASPDFSSLENAPNLREIYLNDNNLTSIEDLRGKTLILQVLHLENNNLTDITPIGNYTTIRELVLYNNNIVNISDLAGMINVTEIDLSENSIVDFSNLRDIPNLESIDLSNNNIDFIPDMSDSWAHLEVLDLDSNNLTDTSGVNGHANLQTLILSNNGITELSGISNLPLLENLVMVWEIPEVIPDDFVFEDNPNSISIIRDSFNSLPLLLLTDETDTFDFGFELGPHVEIYNSISDIDNIGTIDFSDMDIDFIDGDSINLDNLLAIDVSDNNIADISFILGNPSLQVLNISGNSINNLSVISGVDTSDLDNLDQINAANIVTSNDLVDAFIELPELSYLDLTGTNITSINNCFNNLDELTDLGIDSPVLERIIDSFNNLYAVHTADNVISFVDSKIGEINGSFNNGLYEQIIIQDNIAGFSETKIIDSFNNLDSANDISILITGNDFKVVEGSFNNTTAVTLFLGDNNIGTITTSFDGLAVSDELNLQNNKLETLVGLNNAFLIPSLNLSNNILTTVSFLDAVTGLESLDISNQYDSDLDVLTLTEIDGINNMLLLTEIVMEDMLITSIDGFKNIGIDSFILSKTDNNNGTIVSISSTSFSNSLITDLDLGGHQFTNIDFLNNFPQLVDLTISINIADLSDFQDIIFESTLDSLSLENISEVTDFSYLNGYDALTFFYFSSELTLTINNFSGLDSLTSSNFADRASITTINNSFNNMNSMSLTSSYLSLFTSLTDVSTSFNIYENTNSVFIRGNLNIVDSFNNVGTLTLDSGAETSPNFDTLSFDLMHTISIDNSYYDSYNFLNGYTLLSSVTIQELEKNMVGLVNNNITSIVIANVDATVSIIDIDIASSGSLIFNSNTAINIAVSGDNIEYDMSSVGGVVTLSVDNSALSLNGSLNTLTVDSVNLTTTTFDEIETTNMTFNTNLLNQILRTNSSAFNATTININSLSVALDIHVEANTLNIYDNNATTYDLIVEGGNVNLFTIEADLTVGFTGEDLNVAYDSLETMDISGNINNLIIDSNVIDDVNLNNTIVSSVDITSEQSIINVLGTGIVELQITDNNITTPTLTVGSADVTITSTSSAPLTIDVNAGSLNLEIVNLPSIVFVTTSSLGSLDLTDGANVDTLTYNNANILSTHLVTNQAILSVTGTNSTGFDIDANNLTNVTINLAGATFDIDALTTAIAADIVATTVAIDSPNLTDITLTASSIIGTFDILNSVSVDTLSFATANINNLNVNSGVIDISLSSINTLETALQGDNYNTILVDVGTNNISFVSDKTSSIAFDLTASDVSIITTLNTVTINDTSNIVNLAIASDSLTNVLGGSATITTLDVTGSSASLNVTGSNLTSLSVSDVDITTFDANVALATSVELNTSASTLVTINTTSENITITGNSDMSITSPTLVASTINTANNSVVTFNLSKAALNYTLNGVMGDAVVNSNTMDNFVVGTGLILDTLEIINDNITTLDLNPGTVSNLEITSTNTTMNILGNSLVTVIMNMNNLDNMTVNSTASGAIVNASTFASSLSVNGAIDNVIVVGGNLSSVDLNGTIGSVDISGNSLTSVDLTNANYNNLVIDSDVLASLDTSANSVTTSLEVATTINDFNLTSNTPSITFLGDSLDNLNITTSSSVMNLSTTNDSVTLNGATTDFIITGANLNNILGTAKTVDITNETDVLGFVFDLTANSVTFTSNTSTSLLFTGGTTIPTLNLESSSITTINTDNITVNTLNFISTGTVTPVIDTLSETVDISSTSNDTVTLNYSGVNALNISLDSLLLANINISNAHVVNFDGNSTNVELSGSSIDTVDTNALSIANKYTMNDTLITNLDFISTNLLLNIVEIEVNTLNTASIETIITKLEGSGVTLFSPITLANIYDYYYDDKYLELTNQEVLDTLRYQGFRDAAITNAFDEIRLNEYFDYVEDTTLNTTINEQTYSTMQVYYDGYLVSIGETEESLIAANDAAFVQAIKDSIQATLDKTVLVIDELDLNTSVENSIIDDSTIYATTERDNIGFNIG